MKCGVRLARYCIQKRLFKVFVTTVAVNWYGRVFLLKVFARAIVREILSELYLEIWQRTIT